MTGLFGNHTNTHQVVKGLSKAEIRKEIMDADATLRGLSTYEKWFRPPTGEYDANVSSVVDELGFEIVKWNVETDDYKGKDHTKWIPEGIDGIKTKGDKCVVINHDIYESTTDYVQEFINRIKEIGDVTFGHPAVMPHFK